METFLKKWCNEVFEEQIAERIYSFLQEDGYTVFSQIPLFLGRIDFVGIKGDSECLVVETKVAKWKKALKQALRYGYGAEKAYVALPAPTASNLEKKHRETFEDHKIGLIEVSTEVNILIQCKTRTPSLLFKRIILKEIRKREISSRERILKFKEKIRK